MLKMHFFRNVKCTRRLYSLHRLLNMPLFNRKLLLLRKYSDNPRKFITFDEVMAQRREEAGRSLIVQVNSDSSFTELYMYCSQYAEMKKVHHYRNSADEHFLLLEFNTADSLKGVLEGCCSHQKNLDVMSLSSPFLWFRAAPGKKEILHSIDKSLETKDGNEAISEDILFDELMNCKTVSQQMELLYNRTVLNDLGVRLRFMVARQLECILSSLYANVEVKPFGSSVNGFGRMGCDLDLVLTNEVTQNMRDPRKRLVYQEKKYESGRSPWQRHMELLGELLELRVPGATRVQRILHARVPIVKYTHEYAQVDCDLCYVHMSGVYMSELLWIYGSLDPRVRPLAFTVRRWAQSMGLTNIHPGRWITNFPLTLMVIFFLQQNKNGVILPSLKSLIKKSRKEDVRIAEEGISCTFLRDMNKLPTDCYGQSTASLETLLLQFFEFYAQFDFQEKAISIIEGVPIRKPNSLPLYIVNPLEPSLNVSRNVSYEECERLKLEVRNAAWQLEAGLEGGKAEDWGILGITEKRTVRGLKKLLRVGNSQRLVSVRDLFRDEESNETSNSLKSSLQQPIRKSDTEIEQNVREMRDSLAKREEKQEPQIKYRNRKVANEVKRIRKDKIV